MILGTPTISYIMNVIKKREKDALAMPWVNTWATYLLAVRHATAIVEDDKFAVGVSDLVGYDEVVTTKETKMIDAFSSHIIHARTRSACTSVRLSVMNQALCAKDGSLPHGLTIQNAYTQMSKGSRNITIIVRNSTVYPQTRRKKIPVARAVVVTQVPEPQMQPRTIEALDKTHSIQMLKLTMKQRHDKLFKKLDLSGLESWPPELADSAWSPLAEYHDIFSRTQQTWMYSFHCTYDQSH